MNVTSMTQQQKDNSYHQLEQYMKELAKKENCSVHFTQIHHQSYLLIRNKLGSKLDKLIQSNLSLITTQSTQKLNSLTSNILQQAVKQFNHIKFTFQKLSKVFMYMNKNYYLDRKLPSIKEAGYYIYGKMILEQKNLIVKIISGFIEEINKDRNKQFVDHQLLSQFIIFMKEVTIKNNQLKLKLFEYYKKDLIRWGQFESERRMQKYANQYIEDALDIIRSQIERINKYVIINTELVQKMMDVWLIEKGDYIINSRLGLKNLIEQKKIQQSLKFFKLFSLNQKSFQKLLDFICIIIKQKSQCFIEMNKKPENAKQLLIKMMEFYHTFQLISNEFIGTNRKQQIQLIYRVRRTFEQLFNLDQLKIIYKLNFFINQHLLKKKCFEELQKQQEGNQTMHNIHNIFKLIKDKDIFQICYRKFLIKRLIENNNLEQQKQLIKIFKLQCGLSYTSNIQALIKDTIQSQTSLANWIQYRKNVKLNNNNQEFNLQVKLFSKSHWLFQIHNQDIKLNNQQLNETIQSFEKFFKSNSNKIIKWQFNFGEATLKVNFKEEYKILIVNSVMMLILLSFQKCNKKNLGKISQQIKMPIQQLVKHTLPLTKQNILECKDKQLSKQSQLEFNQGFTSKLKKIKVQLRREIKENIISSIVNLNYKDIKADRKIIMESVIVRIMKSRKALDLQNLVKQCQKICQIRGFIIEVELLKSTIKSLIDRQYLKQEKNMCYYLA